MQRSTDTCLLALVALLTGCLPDWDNDWEGLCTMEDDDVLLTIDISDDKYGIVDASLTFTDGDREYDADAEGTRSAHELELDFELDSGDYTFVGLLTAEVDGDEMEAEVTLLGDHYESEGDCELEGS